MKRVARYNLLLPAEGIQTGRFDIYLPVHHQIVQVGIMGYFEFPSLWILSDELDTTKALSKFLVCSTNTRLPDNEAFKHVGTFTDPKDKEKIVWHVFEVIGDY